MRVEEYMIGRYRVVVQGIGSVLVDDMEEAITYMHMLEAMGNSHVWIERG